VRCSTTAARASRCRSRERPAETSGSSTFAFRTTRRSTPATSSLHLNQLKDDLIAVLAHDFKGPLTTIIGFTELLQENALEDEESESALRTIRKSAERLASLANDTLSLSRIEQGELNLASGPVDAAELVKEIVESHAAAREISLDVAAREPVVRGDPARLKQVIDNVVGNAIKYSPNGAPVGVRVVEDDRSVRIAVTDRGIGVPPDELKFLFERFARASNAKRSAIKGTGLGLYLAKTLVERHGGNVEVQSTLGEGSTFTIVLPRLREGVGGMLRVLLLTSDPNLGPFVLHELRARGCATRSDASLSDGLERITVDPVDAVIVDRDTITDDLAPLEAYARAAKPPVSLVAIGGAQERTGWITTLPNPFLAAQLHAAVQRVRQVRESIQS
jgi:hypothetical protein